ncbi:hypothetical protein M758_11G055500 [Ceratodon purpureus]|nr:hypothetical protein M758_11G055500 [Ceratodon purpureus]
MTPIPHLLKKAKFSISRSSSTPSENPPLTSSFQPRRPQRKLAPAREWTAPATTRRSEWAQEPALAPSQPIPWWRPPRPRQRRLSSQLTKLKPFQQSGLARTREGVIRNVMKRGEVQWQEGEAVLRAVRSDQASSAAMARDAAQAGRQLWRAAAKLLRSPLGM